MGKVSVTAQKDRLYLSAMFPRRDGLAGYKQSRLALKLDDTPINRKVAEKRRTYVQRQLDQGTFTWEEHLDTPLRGPTWRDAVNALYRKRVVLGRTGQSTWDTNYMGRLRQANMAAAIDTTSVVQFMGKWPRDTCSYKEAYYLCKDLCQLVNVPFPDLPIPTYSKGQIKEVPDDEEIISTIQALDGELQWHLGMMAAYGLRNQETLECRFAGGDQLHVSDNTKTGFRVVIPCPADWVDLFNLRNERRRTKQGLTQWMHNERKKAGISWKPYALRHAFAGRLWRIGGSKLDIYTAARLLGHSTKEHERTYRAFIDPVTIAERAAQVLQG